MSVYEKAEELVKFINESAEVKAYLALKEKLYADEKCMESIKDFREKQAEVQNLLMQGQDADPEKMEKLQSLYKILVSNPEVKEFFDREVAFDEMLTDIYKTIGDGVKNIIG